MSYLKNAQKLRNDIDSAGAMLTDEQAVAADVETRRFSEPLGKGADTHAGRNPRMGAAEQH